jgi:hypothetical protein
MDFVSDTLRSGRTFRCLNIIDEFNRESLAQYPSHSIPAVRVIEVLEQLREQRGWPEVIVTDNGSEFTSRAFDAWAYARGVRIDFIQPGKPIQNCFVESFNRTFRDDCLNMHWFRSLAEATHTIEAWRRDYNEVRPRSSLGRLTPAEFRQQHQQREEVLAVTPELSVVPRLRTCDRTEAPTTGSSLGAETFPRRRAAERPPRRRARSAVHPVGRTHKREAPQGI